MNTIICPFGVFHGRIATEISDAENINELVDRFVREVTPTKLIWVDVDVAARVECETWDYLKIEQGAEIYAVMRGDEGIDKFADAWGVCDWLGNSDTNLADVDDYVVDLVDLKGVPNTRYPAKNRNLYMRRAPSDLEHAQEVMSWLRNYPEWRVQIDSQVYLP